MYKTTTKKLAFVRNWVVLGLCIFSLEGTCQKCEFYSDSLKSEVVDYMRVDSAQLRGSGFFLLLESGREGSKTYKFENSGDSIRITKMHNGTSQKKVRFGSIKPVEFKSIKLFFIPEVKTSHRFNMLVVKKGDHIMQIIPQASVIEEVLECIKNYDVLLYNQVKSLIELRNDFDSSSQKTMRR